MKSLQVSNLFFKHCFTIVVILKNYFKDKFELRKTLLRI